MSDMRSMTNFFVQSEVRQSLVCVCVWGGGAAMQSQNTLLNLNAHAFLRVCTSVCICARTRACVRDIYNWPNFKMSCING